MMAKQRWSVLLRAPKHSTVDLPGLFDMMRYDRPVVVTWDHMADGELKVTLEFDREPTHARWASFGLVLKKA